MQTGKMRLYHQAYTDKDDYRSVKLYKYCGCATSEYLFESQQLPPPDTTKTHHSQPDHFITYNSSRQHSFKMVALNGFATLIPAFSMLVTFIDSLPGKLLDSG